MKIKQMEKVHRLIDLKLQKAIKQHDFSVLSAIYTDAADMCEQRGDIDEACFFLTQAYVHALQQGSLNAATLHQRLMAYGRES